MGGVAIFRGVGPADFMKSWNEGAWFCSISYRAKKELVRDDQDVCLMSGGRKGYDMMERKAQGGFLEAAIVSVETLVCRHATAKQRKAAVGLMVVK